VGYAVCCGGCFFLWVFRGCCDGVCYYLKWFFSGYCRLVVVV